MNTRHKRSPVWLQPRWERKKQETIKRVTAAIERLEQNKLGVTFSNIREAVKFLYGVSMSSNTIKGSAGAYEVYLAHRHQHRPKMIGALGLQQLIRNTSSSDRRLLLAKIGRMRRERKDDLIAKMVALERQVRDLRDIEDRLRDEIIRLSIGSQGIK